MSSLSTGSTPTFPPGYPPQFSGLSTIPTPVWTPQDDGLSVSPIPLTQALWNSVYLNHTLYNIASTYWGASGLRVVTAAGPVGTNHQPVRMHAPTMSRLVVWEATSEDGTPIAIPDPQPSNYELLLNYAMTFRGPTLDTSGVVRGWEGKGWYCYGMIAPRTVDDGFFAGAPATDTITFLLTQYGRSNFVQGVLGPSPPPAGAIVGFPETGAEGLGL